MMHNLPLGLVQWLEWRTPGGRKGETLGPSRTAAVPRMRWRCASLLVTTLIAVLASGIGSAGTSVRIAMRRLRPPYRLCPKAPSHLSGERSAADVRSPRSCTSRLLVLSDYDAVSPRSPACSGANGLTESYRSD
jgi:hypothetical protein